MIECAPPETFAAREARESPTLDMAEAAARAPLGELVHREVACVNRNTNVDTAARVLAESEADALLVVNDLWAPLGIVSKSDILRAYEDREAGGSDERARCGLERGHHVIAETRSVGDVMTPFAYSLPEGARLSHAISLMASEDVHQVPVVSADGELIGVVTALDCLRWIARRMGYVIPHHT
jgi:CBS domain-containing protein